MSRQHSGHFSTITVATEGAAAAPYDAVPVSAAFPEVPEPLVDQLRVGGRLVQPIGLGGAERVTVFVRIPKGLVPGEVVCHARSLHGRHGYPSQSTPP